MSSRIWSTGCWSSKTDGSVYNRKCLDSGDCVFVLLKSQRLAQCGWPGRAHSGGRHLESPEPGTRLVDAKEALAEKETGC